ncbi:unnamed protein product [Gongylonema pulchrum]|uniref:Uncharacterized protein n=1 Tax=Gongylonema pulchrum TaxID=637853 RepID=A0A183CZ60_9BILA|nr:unnamed protein product [Gongylonema pulchrum]
MEEYAGSSSSSASPLVTSQRSPPFVNERASSNALKEIPTAGTDKTEDNQVFGIRVTDAPVRFPQTVKPDVSAMGTSTRLVPSRQYPDIVPVIPPLITSAKNKEAGVVLSIGEKLRTMMVNKRDSAGDYEASAADARRKMRGRNRIKRGSLSSLEKNLLREDDHENKRTFSAIMRQRSAPSDEEPANGGAFGGKHRDKGHLDKTSTCEDPFVDPDAKAAGRKRRHSLFTRHRSSAAYLQKDDKGSTLYRDNI